MLEKQWRGIWHVVCAGCSRKFELDGTWDVTPSKANTIAVARRAGWRIGKERAICPTCKKNADTDVLK